MTQHMGMMDFSDEEELGEDSSPVVGYLQVLLPPDARALKEIKDGRHATRDKRQLIQRVPVSCVSSVAPVYCCLLLACRLRGAESMDGYSSRSFLFFTGRCCVHILISKFKFLVVCLDHRNTAVCTRRER